MSKNNQIRARAIENELTRMATSGEMLIEHPQLYGEITVHDKLDIENQIYIYFTSSFFLAN